MNMLAFVPLYDPLPALYPGMSEQWLWLVIPLVVAISVVYKCTRVLSVKTLAREAIVMSVQLIGVMIFAGFVLGFGYWAYLKYAGPVIHS